MSLESMLNQYGGSKTALLAAIVSGECRTQKYERGAKSGNFTHKQTNTLTYTSWNSTKMRSKLGSDKENGIDIDPRWSNFENFLADMGERPSYAHQLRRVKKDRGFYKENCRWIKIDTNKKPVWNKKSRTNKKKNSPYNTIVTYMGVSKTVKNWATLFHIAPQTLYSRIFLSKWSILDALCLPVRKRGPKKQSLSNIKGLPMARAAVGDRRKRVIDKRNANKRKNIDNK